MVFWFFLFSADRLFRLLFFPKQRSFDLWSGMITFEGAWNKKLPFQFPFSDDFIFPLIVIALIGFCFLLGRTIQSFGFWSMQSHGLILILSGSVSNLWDRIQYGAIIDYLWIVERSVLNFADVMIVIGFFVFLFATFRPSHVQTDS